MADTVGVVAEKPKKMPITFTLDEEELPQIKDWKVGGKYTITMEVEQVSLDKGMGLEEGKGPLQARFKVLSAKTGSEPEETDEGEDAEGEANGKVTEETPEPSEMSGHKGMPSLHAMVIEIGKKKTKTHPPEKMVRAFTNKMMG